MERMKAKASSIICNEKSELAICMMIIGLFFLITWFFVYVNEPFGDDVLGMFSGGSSYYLDEVEPMLGSRITSLSQVMEALKTSYLYWTGRMPGTVILRIGMLMPGFVTSLITAVITIGICILPLKILYKDIRKGVKHILYFVIIFLAVFWYKTHLYFTYMWTMTSIYSTTVFFCLAYYALAFSDQEHKSNIRHKKIYLVGLQVLGLVAGWSHEVLSITMIAIVGVKWIIDVKNKNVKWYGLFMHTGLGIGYLLGFFAPGNFNRMHQSHDQTSIDVLTRIKISFQMHISILISPSRGMRYLFGIIVVLAIIALIRLLMNKGIKEGIAIFLTNNLPFIWGGVMSIIAWGLVNHVAVYGLDLWIVIAYILLFQTIKMGFEDISINTEWIQTMCGLVLALVVIVINVNEVATYANVSLERRSRIREALENNQDEVVVPMYSNTLPTYRYLLRYLNGQEWYDGEAYREYYGIHIILNSEE